jgi:hypothetical protein
VSIQAVSWAMQQRLNSPTLKFVLIAVANYADEDGFCWPSQKRLSRDTELSERAVRDALKRLEERGILERSERRAATRQSDIIRLNLAYRNEMPVEQAGNGTPAERAAGSKANRKDVPVADQPADDDQTNRQDVPNQPAGGAGNPSIEPSENRHARARVAEKDQGRELRLTRRSSSSSGPNIRPSAAPRSLTRLLHGGISRRTIRKRRSTAPSPTPRSASSRTRRIASW